MLRPPREHNQHKGGKNRMTICLVSSGKGVSERKWVYCNIRNILTSMIDFTQPVFLAPHITCPTTASTNRVHAYLKRFSLLSQLVLNNSPIWNNVGCLHSVLQSAFKEVLTLQNYKHVRFGGPYKRHCWRCSLLGCYTESSTISRKPLKMDVLTFETCCAVNSEIKQVTSSWSIFIQHT